MRVRDLGFIVFAGIFFACASEKDHLITIETRHGNMYAVLYDETDEHKENFIALAEDGRFDSTTFYRIIKNFMIQGGDVFGKENISPEEWYTIPAEFNENFIHEKGSIAAARQGDGINPEKRSSGCQFYIIQGRVYDELELTADMERLQDSFMKFLQLNTNKSLMEQYSQLYQQGDFNGITQLMLSKKKELEDFFNTDLSKKISPQQLKAYTTVGGTPHLDGEYTVFGKVIQGLEVMEKIAAEATTAQDQPLEEVYMKVSVKEMPKEEISKAYGYRYPQQHE